MPTNTIYDNITIEPNTPPSIKGINIEQTQSKRSRDDNDDNNFTSCKMLKYDEDTSSHNQEDSNPKNNKKNEHYISFAKFHSYCNIFSVSESITNTISTCYMQINNLFETDNEIMYLSATTKKCLMVATFIKIGSDRINYKDTFLVSNTESEIIDDMLKEGHKDYRSIPNDYYYYSNGQMDGIFNFIKQFDYNVDIKYKIIDFLKSILNKINNEKIRKGYINIFKNYLIFRNDKITRNDFENYYD